MVTIQNDILEVNTDQDAVAHIVLNMKNLPANVMNADTLSAISEAVTTVVDDPGVRGAIFTSARKEFMAGADLKAVLAFTDRQALFEGITAFNALLRKMETCGKPFVACLNGSALGGGFEIPLACHYRVAKETSCCAWASRSKILGLIPRQRRGHNACPGCGSEWKIHAIHLQGLMGAATAGSKDTDSRW
ncbi:MAG: enoyl-CoA hydratase/isomerase family protein [Bacteroidia bacterium]